MPALRQNPLPSGIYLACYTDTKGVPFPLLPLKWRSCKTVKKFMIENRIVGYGDEDPEQLLANPYNYRIHPSYQQEAVSAVLGEVGWIKHVTVNSLTGHIVDGHLRVMEAIKKGEKSVPVKYVELTETEELEVLATFDPIKALAQKNNIRAQALADRVVTRSNALRETVEAIRPPQMPDSDAPIERLTQEKEANENGVIRLGEYRIILPQAEIAEWWGTVVARHDGNQSQAIAEILKSIGLDLEARHDK